MIIVFRIFRYFWRKAMKTYLNEIQICARSSLPTKYLYNNDEKINKDMFRIQKYYCSMSTFHSNLITSESNV